MLGFKICCILKYMSHKAFNWQESIFCYIKIEIWPLKLLFYGLSDLVISNTRENLKGHSIVLVSVSAIGLRTVVGHQFSFSLPLFLRKRKKTDSLRLKKLQRQINL